MKSATLAYSLLSVAIIRSAVGCASAPDDVYLSLGDGGASQAIDAGIGDAMIRECLITDEGTKRACVCSDNAAGSQACLGGKYTTCACPSGQGPAGTAGTLCKGGFYSGNFAGNFKPSLFGLFGVVESLVEVDIVGEPSGGYPALSLTLEEQASGGGEFRTFTVENGCLIGSAKAGNSDNPFVARFRGSLNCGTGAFDGTIAGNYNLVSTGALFKYEGTLSAQFELPANRLKDGLWNVKEGDALLGGASGGGGGEWNAMWTSQTSPIAGDPCTALDVPDGG